MIMLDTIQPMNNAPKNKTRVLALFRDDLNGNDSMRRWCGVLAVVHHPGLLGADNFDLGWSVSAPVGHGGFIDEDFVGFWPIEGGEKPWGTQA